MEPRVFVRKTLKNPGVHPTRQNVLKFGGKFEIKADEGNAAGDKR